MCANKRSTTSAGSRCPLDLRCYIRYDPADGRYYVALLKQYLQSLCIDVLHVDGEVQPIEQATSAGRADALIMVCTPKALSSQWIDKEIPSFLDGGGEVLPIVFRGAVSFHDIPNSLRSIQWLHEVASRLPRGPSPTLRASLSAALERIHSQRRRELPGAAQGGGMRQSSPSDDPAKPPEGSMSAPIRTKSLFFSYSHSDEELRDQLEKHLKLLQRQGIISMWHDRRIVGGSEWDGEIDRNLEQADIILLLISSDFIHSDYCWNKEVKRALERHDAGEAIVIPVLVRSCDWHAAPFAKLQGLPSDMKAVTAWADRDAAWTDVARGIRHWASRRASLNEVTGDWRLEEAHATCSSGTARTQRPPQSRT